MSAPRFPRIQYGMTYFIPIERVVSGNQGCMAWTHIPKKVAEMVVKR